MTPQEIRDRMAGTRVFVVPYAHCDWAWTHTRAWHERRYVLAFEEVLALLRDNPDFRWYLDCWITELQPLLDRRPDLVPELHTRISQGKIAVCGAFSNVRPNMVGEETFLRNLILGRRRFRSLFPDADLSVHADIVDVALGHPQMPQVLRLAGYAFYRAWRPQAALSAKGIPYEFVWEGLDGSRILCSRGCYGGLIAPDTVPQGFMDHWDDTVVQLWNRELEQVSRCSPTGCVWISQGMDDARPLRSHSGDASIDLPALMEEWNRRESAPMTFATPVEFYRALEEYLPEVPLVRGTLDPCDVCYNAAWGGELGLWRPRILADREITTAEAWQAVAPAGPAPDLTRLWESALLFSAHATQWLFQADFDELQQLARDTCSAARTARRRALEAIAGRVPQPEGCSAIVFNHLPFERQVAVPLLLTAAAGIAEHVRLLDGSGTQVPCQITNDLAVGPKVWEREALASVCLPAFGYTTLTWEPAEKGAAPEPPATLDDDPVLDNGVLRLRFEEGRLASIATPQGYYPAPDGLAWSLLRAYDVDPNGPLHVGEIRGTEDASWQSARVVERGPVRWRHVAVGTVGPHPVTLETRILADEARVEFAATIDWRGADGFLAALWPMPFPGGLTGDVPFGSETKDLDQEPYGRISGHQGENIERLRPGMFYARSFVSLSDCQRGVTYVSHDGDRYYLRDREQATLAQMLINSIRRVQEGWEKHVNIQEQVAEGRHRFTWSILFHPGDWRAADVVRTAASLRSATEVLLPRGAPAPDLPSTGSFLQVEPASVILSAFYAEGDAVILRVWEAEGHPVEARVTLPFAPLTATPVDLNGEEEDDPPVKVNGSALAIRLCPWQIATIRLAVPARFSPAGIP